MKIETVSKEEVIKSILDGSNEEFYHALRFSKRKKHSSESVEKWMSGDRDICFKMTAIRSISLQKIRELAADENSCFIKLID